MAIDAVWPEWWSADAEASISARAELRLTVARRLGIKPSSLLGDTEPVFVWKDTARFKNLGSTSTTEQAILSSFAVSLASILATGAPSPQVPVAEQSALELRRLLTKYSLADVLALGWACGIPVVQTLVFPLPQKRMHAVCAQWRGRYAVILGESTRFPAKAAFTVAHELGHIFLGHTGTSPTLLDIEDPAREQPDDEEEAANTFALQLLTGRTELDITRPPGDFNPAQLASAALEHSSAWGIDPGTIVLIFARQHNEWARGTAALKLLGEGDVGGAINRLARTMFHWDALGMDQQEYLDTVMGK